MNKMYWYSMMAKKGFNRKQCMFIATLANDVYILIIIGPQSK